MVFHLEQSEPTGRPAGADEQPIFPQVTTRFADRLAECEVEAMEAIAGLAGDVGAHDELACAFDEAVGRDEEEIGF